MSRTRGSTFIGLLVASLWLAGCADPCTDDGLAWKQKESCAQGSASATEGSTTSASATASASATTSASASASATDSATGSGSASATGTGTDTDPASASATMTATGGDGCSDGVQNGDETDVDCGGSCGATCESGEMCVVDGDCVSMACGGGVCVDAMCAVTMDDNGCQACIKTNCCDGVIDCLADPKCTCWLDCIQHNNDFMPCVQTCMLNAKPGAITSCANSKCNTINACAKP